MRITRHRAIAAVAAAAIAISSLAVSPASARPYHHHRSAGGVAGRGAVAGVFGTFAALAARDRYERLFGYGPYYAPPPASYGYYGPGPYGRY